MKKMLSGSLALCACVVTILFVLCSNEQGDGTTSLRNLTGGSDSTGSGYTLTISANNGTVTKNPKQNYYSAGATVTLTATPNSGYKFSSWTGDTISANASITITMNANKSLNANFSPVSVATYLLTINATTGTVTESPSKTAYDSGEVVTLTAHPNSGYAFTTWSGDTTGTGITISIKMNKDKTVNAAFQLLNIPVIAAATAGDSSVTLSWNSIAGATSYNIYYVAGTIVDKTGTKINVVTPSKIIKGLTNGTQYAFAVSAVFAGGESGLSTIQTATPLAPPQKPTLISPANSSTGQSLTDTLKWSTVAGATSYHLQVSTSSTFATILIEDSTLTYASKILSGITNYATIYWRVQAKNAVGVSGWTNAWSQFILNLNNREYNNNLGAIPLTGLAPQTAVIPLGPYIVTTDVTLPIITDTLNIANVRQITFDVASVPLQIRLTNTTPSTIKNITFRILGFVTTTNVGNLDPGATTTFSYPVGGYGASHIANHDSSFLLLQMTGTIAGTGSPVFIGAGQGLNCQMSFTGMTLMDAILKDSLITLNRTFTNRYTLTDSPNLNYIDFINGSFVYTVGNGSGTSFSVNAVHEDLWLTSKCEGKTPPVRTKAALSQMVADSQSSFAGLISSFIIGSHSTTTNTTLPPLNVSACRVFPTRDSTLSNSITTVNFTLQNISSTGKWDTISATDSIVITISPNAIQCSRIALIENPLDNLYVEGKTTIKYAKWENSIMNLFINGNMLLTKVNGMVLKG